jgi:hypothetical protein
MQRSFTSQTLYRRNAGGKLRLRRFSFSEYAAKRLQLMMEKKTEQEVNLAEILNARWISNPPSDYSDRLPKTSVGQEMQLRLKHLGTSR